MTGAIRCGVIGLLVGLAAPSAAQQTARDATRTPSALLPLETLWTAVLPAPPATAPVHEDGQLFVALRTGHLVAVSLADGQVGWEIEQSVVGQPAVGNRSLFVAGSDELVGLDTATGTALWAIPLEAPPSAPLVWNAGWLIATLEPGTVLALRADTGETIWSRTFSAGITVRPALAGDRMYVSLVDGGLAALSLLTGETVWERQLGGAPQQVLPLDDLFVGASDNHFYRLARADGSEQWRWRAGGDVVGAPAVDEERVFFSSLDNVVWALDRASGVQQWRAPLAARPMAGPSYVGDLLVFGGLSQEIRFFDPTDGMSYGRVGLPAELAFPPLHLPGAIGEPTLVFVTGDGRLQALGPATVPVLLDPAVAPMFPEDPASKNLTDADATSTAATAPPSPAADAGDVTPTTGPSVGGDYAVQVAAFATEANASALADRLADANFPAYVVAPQPGDDPVVYRVRIGDFPDRASAETAGQRVADDQALEWYVVTLP